MSVGFDVGQFVARGIVKRDGTDCVAAHPLNVASTNHVTFEAGKGALNCVDVVVPITTAAAPLTCANTR